VPVKADLQRGAGRPITHAVLRCRLFGHRLRFGAQGTELHWHCARDCGAAGSRRYETAADARRYARVLSRGPRDDLGRRAPPFGLLPLRIADRVLKRGR
jgi:hypothetical protein